MGYNNHFFCSYSGNKRNEAKEIIKNIKFDNKIFIVEPFCGTAAISFYIWLEYGDKFEYYLNDNSKSLISLYELFKNNTIDDIKKEINNIDDQITNKESWNYHYTHSPQTVYKELYYLKYSALGRKGFYPLNRKTNNFNINEKQELFIQFIRSPNVYITNDDWFKTFESFDNDDEAIIIIDPPYINTNNDFYLNKDLNIYQFFYDNMNNKYKSDIYFILEDIWIIRLLFNKYNILSQYDKKYEISKKKTKHILLCNN